MAENETSKEPESEEQVESSPVIEAPPSVVPGPVSAAPSIPESRDKPRGCLQRLLILPPIIFAVGVVGFLISLNKGSPRQKAPERVLTVRTLKLALTDVVPRALGRGVVRPTRTWSLVSKVPGTVEAIHESLSEGALVGSGTTLVKLDSSDYKFAIEQVDAKYAEAKAQLSELGDTEESLKASLLIEQRALDLANKKLARDRKLLASGSLSRVGADNSERDTLKQLGAVQKLKNTLRELPSKRIGLSARLKSLEVQKKQAVLDLDRTELRAPFGLRLRQVMVEREQFVGRGQVLAKADGIDAVEIPAQISVDRIRHLFQNLKLPRLGSLADKSKIFKAMGLSAEVRLREGTLVAHWNARLDRTSGASDPRSRTFSFIVIVDKPYEKVIASRRPPLVEGMFVEVELKGRPIENCIVVPRSALHGDKVYIVNDKSRLEARPVKISFRQQDFVVLASGLKAGDELVVSDPVPAIEGIKLVVTEDKELAATLLAQAKGGGQ